jgi:hypothetical protein
MILYVIASVSEAIQRQPCALCRQSAFCIATKRKRYQKFYFFDKIVKEEDKRKQKCLQQR